MTIILNSGNIHNIEIALIKKNQKTNGCNYFFTPNIGLKLFYPKIIPLDYKSLNLVFEKKNNLNLLTMLRHINNILKNKLYDCNPELKNSNTVYDIMSEQENTFMIRCHLPNNKGSYFIKYQISDSDDNYSLGFYKPPKYITTYASVILEFRNIWSINNKCGFNMEIKEVMN